MIELFPIWVGGKAGYVYNVTLNGDLIVERSKDPEHDLARVLLSRGMTGKVTVHDGKTGKPRTIVDIEKAARFYVSEENRDGLRLRHYQHPDSSPSAGEREAA